MGFKTKWQDHFYWKAYALAKGGMSNEQIALTFGVVPTVLASWIKKRPALAEALEVARSEPKNEFHEYVYGQLSPELRRVYDQIMEIQPGDPQRLPKIRKVLMKEDESSRQQLYLYVLTRTGYNPSKACKKLGIPKRVVDRWVEYDEEFSRLLDEIEWHKKNFFEHALVRKVQEGDSAAIMFANRTINRDRGYSEKHTVEVSGKIEHQLYIEDLDLPLDVRKAILEAVRKRQQEQDVIEVEPQRRLA